MSNFLVPSSVVARRKTSTTTSTTHRQPPPHTGDHLSFATPAAEGLEDKNNDGFPLLPGGGGATATITSASSNNNPPPGFSAPDIAAAAPSQPEPPLLKTNIDDDNPWRQQFSSSAYQHGGGSSAASASADASSPSTDAFSLFPYAPPPPPSSSSAAGDDTSHSLLLPEGILSSSFAATAAATATTAAAPLPLLASTGFSAAFTTATSTTSTPAGIFPPFNNNNNNNTHIDSSAAPPPLGDDALIAFANTDIIMSGGVGDDQLAQSNHIAEIDDHNPPRPPLPASSPQQDDDDASATGTAGETEINTTKTLRGKDSNDNDDNEDANMNLKMVVKTIARENIVNSPFHHALVQKLQHQQQNSGSSGNGGGMTLTEVLSILLGFPDLLNLFCTIQSQYDVLPNELLLELPNIKVRPRRQQPQRQDGDDGEEEEELFYYDSSSSSSDDHVVSPSSSSGNQGAGNNYLVEADSSNNGMVVPPSPSSQQSSSPVSSSSSTSPTTVTTTSSSSMDMEDDDNAMSSPSEGVLYRSNKGRNSSNHGRGGDDDEALSSVATVSNNENAKSSRVSEQISTTTTTTTETTTTTTIATQEEEEDRNDVTCNSNDNDKSGTKERDDDDNNDTRQTEIEITSSEEKSDCGTTTAKDSPRKSKTTQTTDNSETPPPEATATAAATTKAMMPLLRPQTTLRPDHQKPPLPFHIRQSTDALAALEFLVVLHKGCDSSASWPESQIQLKIFLTKITNCCFSKNAKGEPKENLPQLFCAWFEDIMKQYKKDPKRLSKIRKTATAQLLEQLEKMECIVTESSDSLRWNDRKVNALVKGYHKQREMEQQDGANKQKKERRDGKTSSSDAVKKAASEDSADNNNNNNAAGDDDKSEKKSISKNIWQNHNKVEALVNGYQARGGGSAVPKPNPKADLSLVPLKKLGSRPSGKKSILGMPQQQAPLATAPKQQQQQQRILSHTTGSVWKVAPPGPLRPLKPKEGEVTASQKQGKETPSSSRGGDGTHLNNALRPLRPLTSQPKHTTTPAASASRAAASAAAAANPKMEQQTTTKTSEEQVSANDCDPLPSAQLGQSNGAFVQVQAVSPTYTPTTTPHVVTSHSQSTSPHNPSSPTPLRTSNDVPILLELLPDDLAAELSDPILQQQLTDIILDKGRQPVIWASGVRKFLCGDSDDHRVVTTYDIDSIVEKLGGFGDSNRVGLDQQLHSVSAIRNRKNDIIGLSMRVGRHISGIATMISDLLFSDPTKSILLLGEPGSGKTTILREVTRLLAKESDVMIVDTVNEIAGDGDIPHEAVGQARRMMVPSLANQGSIMMECVQNHTPEVMVVDKLGSPGEVPAALAVKDSGTRLIASLNGNLPKLVKNTKLQGLLGLETVVIGQSLTKNATTNNNTGNGEGGGRSSLGAKSVLHRTGTPVFDLVVELCPGTHHEWKIIFDTSVAVDSILQGGTYECQHRIRDAPTGQHRIHHDSTITSTVLEK